MNINKAFNEGTNITRKGLSEIAENLNVSKKTSSFMDCFKHPQKLERTPDEDIFEVQVIKYGPQDIGPKDVKNVEEDSSIYTEIEGSVARQNKALEERERKQRELQEQIDTDNIIACVAMDDMMRQEQHLSNLSHIAEDIPLAKVEEDFINPREVEVFSTGDDMLTHTGFEDDLYTTDGNPFSSLDDDINIFGDNSDFFGF